MGTHPEGPLADALVTYGVALELVDIEWDDVCQEDVLTFSGALFPDTIIKRLADLSLSFPSRFVFATDALQGDFERAVMTSPAMLRAMAEADRAETRLLQASGLSSFAAFDPGSESLNEFAYRVEEACGFARGEVIVIRGNETIFVDPARPELCLTTGMGLLMALLRQCAPDVPTGVIAGGRLA